MTRRIRLLLLVILGTPVFLGLAFVALWAGGLIVYEPSLYQKFHQEFPYSKITGIEVAPLYPQPMPPSKGTAEFDRFLALPLFHDYRVDGFWRTIDPEYVDDATDLILNSAVLDSSSIAECFYPGFALKIQTDTGPIDMLVCLQCEQALLILPDDSASWTVSFSPSGLHSAKAFYVDCFVLNNFGLTPSVPVKTRSNPPTTELGPR